MKMLSPLKLNAAYVCNAPQSYRAYVTLFAIFLKS